MTVIVSVKINDGVVMASDSASTFGSGQIYLHSDKIVNLVKGLPIGAMVAGYGGIGNESVTTLLKDLRCRLAGTDGADWRLDPRSYSLEAVATRVRGFLFEEKAKNGEIETWMKIRICGYSAGKPLSEVWEVLLRGKECDEPFQVQGENDFGPRWDGEYEAINRLILGQASGLAKAAEEVGIPSEQLQLLTNKTAANCCEFLTLPAMPIQDAIDLARFLVETTIGFTRFSVLKQPKTVGGAVEIAAITKHEGFRWVQRKHFYQASLNAGIGAVSDAHFWAGQSSAIGDAVDGTAGMKGMGSGACSSGGR